MLHLVIGNKRYSSWSMRPWLVLKAFDIPFDETVVPLKQPETRAQILQFSPTGKVPVLIDGDTRVWESLAIIEYLADIFPDKGIWPKDVVARAHARAIASEMHAGFQPLRQTLPMNVGERYAVPMPSDELKANIDRIENIWHEARAKFGAGGRFLYGAFSAADAMYVPVVTRFETYRIPVASDTRLYMHAVTAHPAVKAWIDQARLETCTIADYELTPGGT